MKVIGVLIGLFYVNKRPSELLLDVVIIFIIDSKWLEKIGKVELILNIFKEVDRFVQLKLKR